MLHALLAVVHDGGEDDDGHGQGKDLNTISSNENKFTANFINWASVFAKIDLQIKHSH